MKSKKSSPPRARNVKQQVVLIVLDGWGIAQNGEYNAISIAKKPNFDSIREEFGVQQICASGECVGLTRGQMGNSEVGHLTIGAGKIIFQDLLRVYDEISSGRLGRNTTLLRSLQSLRSQGGTLHCMGLLSDGGVHSHIEHLFSLLRIAKENKIDRIVVHAFLDGRDTPPRSGVNYLAALQSTLSGLGGMASIGTISGRYYAMDRDNRWERTKLAYDAIVYAKGEKFEDPILSTEKSYSANVNDEFIVPMVNQTYRGMSDGDLVLFYNFRPDRARQLTRALSQSSKEFGNLFDRNEHARPRKLNVLSMTIYDPKFKQVKPLLGREHVSSTLSNVLERNRVRQLRIAETEKYAHVTYFFNGLVEKPRRFEDRILVPSPDVETYDKKPEMSAPEIAKEAVKAIEGRKYGFILVNFANADMVGHSGKVEPTVKAVETVDKSLGQIIRAWKNRSEDLTLIVTADHGNAEKLYDATTGQPHTAHTSNPVPLIIVSKQWKLDSDPGRTIGLRDIAPTVLKIMGIRQPKAMSGRPMVTNYNQSVK